MTKRELKECVTNNFIKLDASSRKENLNLVKQIKNELES